MDDEIFRSMHAIVTKDSRPSSAKKGTKNNHWFETCDISKVKELYRVATGPVSGTKDNLFERLTANEVTKEYGHTTAPGLKLFVQKRLLVHSVNKYDQFLHLLHAEFEVGTVKLTATKTVVDEVGHKVDVAMKKRMAVFSAQTLQICVEKKINSACQKKYQSHYDGKCHAHVYSLMREMLEEHVVARKIAKNKPLTAYNMIGAAFSALKDDWVCLERHIRPRYGDVDFHWTM